VRAQEVLIAGWRPGKGRRAGRIGALILAVHDGGGELRLAGGVGTGSPNACSTTSPSTCARSSVTCRRSRTPSPGPRPATRTGVSPRLVGEVAYTEWTSDFRIRHPSWRGLRPDKNPDDVVCED
jgi:bifunctional non-homologous end joining protein LigD